MEYRFSGMNPSKIESMQIQNKIINNEMQPIKEIVMPNHLFNPDKNWKEYSLYFKLKDILQKSFKVLK